MANQIPYDDPIWDLTPTEFQVAYLSLSSSKKEIADKLMTSEDTVGTHRTRVFQKLGFGGFEDEEKLPLLISQYGPIIERLVSELGENYKAAFRDRKKEALEKREEAKRQQQAPPTSSVPSRMSESPPEPILRLPFSMAMLSRRDLIMVVTGFTAGMCLFGAIILTGNRLLAPTGSPTPIFTNSPTQLSLSAPISPSRTPTSNIPPISNASPTSTLSPTPEITPTAISLPIREDFNSDYGPLWTKFGDPFLATASERGKYLGYDGVLTVRYRDRGAIAIGNTAWKDYIIFLRANHTQEYGDVSFEVSFRMKDIDNRIVLSCNYSDCDWFIIWKGKKDVLKENDPMYINEKLNITVVGDLFTATSIQNYSTQLGLPPKYLGQFEGGGVMIELFDYELDFVEIQEFR